MVEVVALRPKTWAYLMDGGNEHKKAKGTKKCVIKQKLMFENHKDRLFNNKIVYRSQKRFKSYYHDVYTEEVNKIAIYWPKNWPYTHDHPYRIFIIGGLGSEKTNASLNLMENQPDIDKIYLYAKDPYEAKYQYLINKRESVGINHFNDPKAFIEYSNDMRNVYKNINYYNPYKENKILIAFDDVIADMINNKKLYSIVTKMFIRGRKLSISLVFKTQSYF